MSAPRDSTSSLLVVACFSRHPEALAWAEEQMQPMYGAIRLRSADYDFHHTRYYEPEMGPGLRKRLVVFEPLAAPDCLPDVKRRTIELERALAASTRFAEARPINLDPGLLQLGKFLLASTKDQGHRIYLRDGIFAEVTLRFHAGVFEAWPWTYADYREPEVMRFLTEARGILQGLLR
jgi:Domain of unknown function (DUF4416)